MSYERILLAHDLSENSDEALRHAVDMAKRHDAALTVLHVYPIPVIPMPEGYVVHGPAALVEIQETIQRALERLQQQAIARGLKSVRIEAKAGAAAEAILDTAVEGGFDLIVMGTHGRKGLRRMILGSVAEAVVRRAPCPVLTVHPGPAEVPLETPAR
jgi:nucleotide-binding universal stress UspA family protein